MLLSLVALVAAYFVYVSAASQKKGSLQKKAGIALTVVLILSAVLFSVWCIQGCLAGHCWMDALKK
jgi:asparagine N-glycosylation enzyme membrane subunit Stt3